MLAVASLLIFLCEVLQSSSSFVRSWPEVSAAIVLTAGDDGAEEGAESVPETLTKASTHDALIAIVLLPGLAIGSLSYSHWSPRDPGDFAPREKIRPPIC